MEIFRERPSLSVVVFQCQFSSSLLSPPLDITVDSSKIPVQFFTKTQNKSQNLNGSRSGLFIFGRAIVSSGATKQHLRSDQGPEYSEPTFCQSVRNTYISLRVKKLTKSSVTNNYKKPHLVDPLYMPIPLIIYTINIMMIMIIFTQPLSLVLRH